VSPRIYVASLSDYNAGKLHGVWIDLDEATTADEVWEQINEMLATGEPGAEEWAIHDHEGFDNLISEHENSIEFVVALAAALSEYGDAFRAYLENDSSRELSDALSGFQEDYQGEFRSEQDFAESLADDMGWYRAMEAAGINPSYFDEEAFCRDLFCGDYWSADDSATGVYVFRSS
jgi:antirestriction protein